MSEIALSTGCFTGYEDRLASAPLHTVELASHGTDALHRVTTALVDRGVRILGVHSPCPSRGFVPDLAARGRRWRQTADAVSETVMLATALGARYVVVHAFYCVDGDLPADDVERANALRSSASGASIADYLDSEAYAAAKAQARRNLETLLGELPGGRHAPTLVLENLNPRVGYGGILPDDIVEMADELDGEVGVCLDLGHLVLAAAALGRDLEDQVLRARDLVRVVHVHQNFGGRYFVDRWWNESHARPGLQEVDAHLPLLAGYTRDDRPARWSATADNRAFEQLSRGPVVYATRPGAEPVEGAVTERLLSLVDGSVPRVLELDSRYAPLGDILAEYEAARSGRHAVLSR